MLCSTCSMASTEYPEVLSSFTACTASWQYSHSTASSAPSAVLCISCIGGQLVMPQRMIFSILKASAVLNMEPTLYILLISSRTITRGNLPDSLNWFTDNLCNSVTFNFLIISIVMSQS